MTAVDVREELHDVDGEAGQIDLPRRGRPGMLRRFVRGRPADPAWVRPALIALLLVTGLLYLWDLGASGWANSFYSAAVQAGTRSWKAFFFGSFDSSNFITVDKSPASLWVMELSARVFGVNPWSILVPEALEGVATVGVLYLTIRRWFSPAAALLAGAGVAVTPVAALMFRFNNPDAFMVLLLTCSAYATVRAIEDHRARWIVLAGSLVGFGFLAKMLQAFLVVPGLAAAYLIAAEGSLGRRVRNLVYGGAAMLVSAGWWVAAVELTPKADRPYIGGSQDDSLWNLIFGYNGFGRLTGNETGSVGGGGTGAGRWGPTGLLRLFGSDMGSQISWLLPAALILLAGGLFAVWRLDRRNRTRAALVMWGGWLVVTGLAISLGQGIIHPYYTVALAPAVGAVVAVGATAVWPFRRGRLGRAFLAAAVGATAVWSYVLLDRSPAWLPWLRTVVVVAGLLSAMVILVWTSLGAWARRALVSTAVAASLAGPLSFTIDTVATPYAGAIPSAGPAQTGAGGGPPGAGGAPGGFRPGAGFANPGQQAGGAQGFGGPGAGFGGQVPGGQLPGGQIPGGQLPGGQPPGGQVPGGQFGGGQFAGNAAGGLLQGSNPGKALVSYLESGSASYKWMAAAVGANEAAGYQLATGRPVMAIGGFNGTDPTPTLSQFQKFVAAGEVRYFVGGGGRGGPGGPAGGSAAASAITSWVESHFASTSVGGITVYDLSHPLAGRS